MKLKKAKVFRLPAYTTILCQSFSLDGNYLAVGSDFGRIAVYKVANLVSEGRSTKDNQIGQNKSKEKSVKKNSAFLYFDVRSSEASGSRQIFSVCIPFYIRIPNIILWRFCKTHVSNIYGKCYMVLRLFRDVRIENLQTLPHKLLLGRSVVCVGSGNLPRTGRWILVGLHF